MKAPKATGSTFEKHPAGSVALVNTRIIDTGTVFNEAKNKDEHKITLAFESSKLMSEGEYAGQPFLVFANFNFSMYQNSHLCQFIENWLGQRFANQAIADNFDLSKLLGKPLFANIVHNDDFVNIQSPMPIPDGMTPPTPVGELILFDLSDPDRNVFEKLSDKFKEKITKSNEWQALKGEPVPVAAGQDFDDDIPF